MEQNKNELLEELRETITDMDLPQRRKTDLIDPKWILRNIMFRNSSHPNYEKTINICKKLLIN